MAEIRDHGTLAHRKPIVRLKGIDICRSVAIFLAMLSHASIEFKLFHYTGDSLSLLKFAMPMATPMFICLFGAMLELVYARRMLEGQTSTTTSRLLVRAGQCYLLYALAILARVAVGDYSLGFGLRCLLLIGATPYSDILKFYCLALAMAPLLIALRVRFGLGRVAIAGMAIHLAYPLLSIIPPPPLIAGKDYIGMGTRFLVGIGQSDVAGPSLLHGLSLVFGGMFLGRALIAIRQADRQVSRRGWQALFALASFFVIVSLALWDWTDPVGTAIQTTDLTLRNQNNPLYTSFGLATTTIAVMLGTYLFDRKGIRAMDWIRFIGSVSLFTFAFGNILLVLQPFEVSGTTSSVGLFLLYGSLIALQSYLFYTMMRTDPGDASGLLGSATRLVQRITERSSAIIQEATAFLIPAYVKLLRKIAPEMEGAMTISQATQRKVQREGVA